eukprot:gene11982-10345_t
MDSTGNTTTAALPTTGNPSAMAGANGGLLPQPATSVTTTAMQPANGGRPPCPAVAFPGAGASRPFRGTLPCL